MTTSVTAPESICRQSSGVTKPLTVTPPRLRQMNSVALSMPECKRRETDFLQFPHIRDGTGCGSISQNPSLLLLTPFGLKPRTEGFNRSSYEACLPDSIATPARFIF
jgi:hypothetical protein